ncbi:MAG: nucleotidyltransferase domain-containing protein [Planctomycetia bacterium]|nr:nucleotidyltransferase domain-containing protein [Planctomycetia bacterium]
MIQPFSPLRDSTGHTIDLSPVSGLLGRIERAWRPVGVWLFGSRARGGATRESDWDLLVVVPDAETAADDPLAGWNVAKEARVRADVVLCRASEFEDARETPNTLAYEAAHFGIQVHGH